MKRALLMPRVGPTGLLLPRLLGVLSLRPSAFAEVARDPGAGLQAGIIVILEGILEATVDAAIHELPKVDATLVLGWVLAAVIGWVLWTGIVWLVGVRFFQHPADFGAIVRGVAFAHATSLFYGLGAVPAMTEWSGLVYFASLVWFTAALHAAIRGIFGVPFRRAGAILAVALGIRIVAFEVLPYALRVVPSGRS